MIEIASRSKEVWVVSRCFGRPLERAQRVPEISGAPGLAPKRSGGATRRPAAGAPHSPPSPHHSPCCPDLPRRDRPAFPPVAATFPLLPRASQPLIARISPPPHNTRPMSTIRSSWGSKARDSLLLRTPHPRSTRSTLNTSSPSWGPCCITLEQSITPYYQHSQRSRCNKRNRHRTP